MFVTFLSVETFAQNYNWEWARTANGKSGENANCVCTDIAGNVFVAGYFYSDTLILDSDTLKNRGNYDVFLAKYNPLGNLLWTVSGGGIFDDVATSLTTDVNGNVFVTGYFFSPNFIIKNDTLLNAGAGDIFILSFDSIGNLRWTKHFGGSGDESGNAIGCDIAGNILLSGYFQSSLFALVVDTLFNSGNDDVFLAKLNNSGNVMWAKGISGSLNDRANSLTTDASANIFITGYFFSSPFISENDTINSSGSNDVFLAKFDAMGNSLWLKASGGSFNDSGDGISTDSFGNVILVSTSNSNTFSAGNYTMTNTGGFDVFVVKYDNSGNELWADVQGGIFDEKAYVVRSDASGNIFITGHFHSPNIILGTDTFMNEGIGDIFLLNYSSNGNIQWAEQIGGSADDGSSGLALDVFGNIFLSGYFISPSVSCGTVTLNNSGAEDLLLAKLTRKNLPTTIGVLMEPTSLNVYPNPTDGKLTVKVDQQTTIFQIELYNQNGKLIFLENKLFADSISVNLTIQTNGLYFLKVITDKGMYVKKILIFQH